MLNEHNDLENSIKFSKELIELSLTANDKKTEANARHELGYSYMNQNKFELANEQFLIAEEIYREKGDLYNAILVLNNRAASSARGGYDIDYCLNLQKKIVKEVHENDLDYPLEYVFGILSAAYVEKEDWKQAIVFQDQYFFSKLTAEHKKYNNKVYQIEASHENEQVKREKQGVEKMLEAEKLLGKSKEKKVFLILVLLLTVIFSSIVLLRMYSLKRKANERLVAEVEIKELLLKEVNHRVKNNMQMVSSLLTLQSARVKSTETKDALKIGVSRIKALGFAHQELYKGDDFTFIKIGEYLKLIADSLCRRTEVKIEVDVEKEFKMHIEKAQALGFIVNELITNSIKYAWEENDDDSAILIKIIEFEEDILFMYKDNGIGYGENKEGLVGQSLGSSLMHSFIERQLNGTYSYYTDNGAVMEIKYKLSDVI